MVVLDPKAQHEEGAVLKVLTGQPRMFRMHCIDAIAAVVAALVRSCSRREFEPVVKEEQQTGVAIGQVTWQLPPQCDFGCNAVVEPANSLIEKNIYKRT
jgi:hypothetical protein